MQMHPDSSNATALPGEPPLYSSPLATSPLRQHFQDPQSALPWSGTPTWPTNSGSFEKAPASQLRALSSSIRPSQCLARVHWANRYAAWQARAQAEQIQLADADVRKQRMFGEGDGSGEDEGLCVKMLEFFGGLDFIDL